MPNIPQQQTIVQYVTNVSQFNYTFAFYAPLNTDIQVYYQAANAVPIPSNDILDLNVDYTVTYNADPTTGGFITLLFTPTSGYYLTINRNVAASLNTNFANAQTFNGANLDAALDRLLLLIQQNQNYILERNLSYIINTYLPSAQPYTQLPPLPLNNIWVGSSGGVVAALLAPTPSASVLQSLLASQSPGTAGATLVGYYNTVTSSGETVQQALDNIFQTFSLVPTGVMLDFGGTVAPAGYLGCDGSAVSRTTYAALFAVIGTTWGVGDGSTTFNLPDFRRRTTVGSGGSGTGTLGNAVGNNGGTETHTMTVSEMVNHNHALSGTATISGTQTSGGSGGIAVQVNQYTAPPTAEPSLIAGLTSAVGSTTPFNIIQPSNIVLKIIKT